MWAEGAKAEAECPRWGQEERKKQEAKQIQKKGKVLDEKEILKGTAAVGLGTIGEEEEFEEEKTKGRQARDDDGDAEEAAAGSKGSASDKEVRMLRFWGEARVLCWSESWSL